MTYHVVVQTSPSGILWRASATLAAEGTLLSMAESYGDTEQIAAANAVELAISKAQDSISEQGK